MMTITEFNTKTSFPLEVEYIGHDGELHTVRCNSYEVTALIRKSVDIIRIDLSDDIYDLLDCIPLREG